MIAVIVVVFVIACGIITLLLNQDTKRLEEEQKIYSTLDTTLKDGTKIETQYYNLDDGKFFVKVPKNFTQMDAETIAIKYPNAEAPNIVFTNEETTINVAISLTEHVLPDNQMETYLENVKKTLVNFQDVKATTFQRDHHTVGEIEFVSQASDTAIYNHMISFSNNGFLAIVTFNCTQEQEENWKEVGNFIINSLMFPADEQ